MMSSPLVFISHNRADEMAAGEIASFLVTEGVDVWFDKWQIKPGDSIVEGVDFGLSNCDFFIIIWSEHAAKSSWVNKEWTSALSKSIKKKSPIIIPIILDETEIPTILEDLMRISYKGGIEETRRALIAAILFREPSMNYVKAVVKKYHELISDENPGNPVGLKACPECGSTHFVIHTQNDYEHDETYYIFECKACKHTEWTQ